MPTILLIRHGQASFGTDDYDRLSDLGIRQAQVTADALGQRRMNVNRVISGTMRRQIDTAAPMAATFARDPEVDARWNEYAMDEILAAHNIDAPESTIADPQMSSAAFQDILETALGGWISAADGTPAPESWPRFNGRVATALQEAVGLLNAGETALVFTSGGVIAAVCAQLLGLGAGQLLALNRVAVNTGITKIAAGSRGLSLISFNDHSHLENVDPGLITYR